MPFDLPALREMFAFQRWATGKILDCVAPLTDEEFRQPIGGSFGSLSGTLVHAYGADWVWLERLRGRSPRSLPEGDDALDFPALREKWSAIESERDAYVASLSPERLKESLAYVNFAGESCEYRVDEVLFHIANHLTYHRGQITNFLRHLGAEPVATDLVVYYMENPPA